MKAILTNLQIPQELWEKFTRQELRDLATKHNIMRGQNKRDTAFLLSKGAQYETADPAIFTVTIEIIEVE